MAIIELASTPKFSCSDVAIMLDRSATASDPLGTALVRNLGWVGFEAVTLDKWVDQAIGARTEDIPMDVTSSRWLALSMEA